MVFSRTWSEELVAEWLIALGYAVLVGVPVGTGRGGGRKEADVVGFKSEKERIRIIHFEISHMWKSTKDIVNYVSKKFSDERVEYIKQYIASIAGSDNIVYEKHIIVFTSQGVLEKAKKILEEKGIKLWGFQEFFNTQVFPIVVEKVEKARTFPDSLWPSICYMLYTLCCEKLLRECS